MSMTQTMNADSAMVEAFAEAMKTKLARATEKGRGGWNDPDTCSAPFLHDLLREHVVKDNLDMVDVGNLAGMLWMRMQTVPGDREAVEAHLAALEEARPRPLPVPDPAGLTPREQDAALGEALGLCVWIPGGTLDNPVRALVRFEEAGDEVLLLPEPVKRASDWNKAPRYHANRDVCAVAEAQMERMGLMEAYAARLVVEAQREVFRPALHALAGASAAARVRAMLAVLPVATA